MEEIAEAGYLSPKAVFIDGTHIKANANNKKQVKVQIPAAFRHYAKELMEEVNEDREAHGKKPFDDDEPGAPAKKRRDNTSKKKLARRKKEKLRTVTRSVTDPDSGLFVKRDHKRQFAYEAHTACDKHGFVLEAVVTPGNVHDSVAFDEVYDRVTADFPEVETIVAHSAYKTPHICKRYLKTDVCCPPPTSGLRPRKAAMNGGNMCMTNTMTVYSAPSTGLCPTALPTGMDTGSTAVILASVSTVLHVIYVPILKIVSKRYSGTSGGIMRT